MDPRTLRWPAVGAAILFLAACGGASGVTGGSSADLSAAPQSRAVAPAAGTAAAPAAPAGGAAAVGAPAKTGAPNSVAPLPPVPIGGTGKLVRTVAMTVEVPNGKFDDALTSAFTLAGRYGGVVSGSDASNGGESRIRVGTVRLSIPADKLDDAIAELRTMGTVDAFHVDAQDVGAQYVDLAARLKNAEAQRDAWLALLERATSIGDIVNLQNQVGQIEGQIEQLKGQMAYLDRATSFSTVTVTFREKGVAPAPAPVDDWGTRTAFGQGIHAFVTSFNVLVVGLLAAGPWLILGALVVAGVLWRRRSAVAGGRA